jgi:SAM-dependent methyltransferase
LQRNVMRDKCQICGNENNTPILSFTVKRILHCHFCGVTRTSPAPMPPNYDAEDFHEHYSTFSDLPSVWQNSINMQVKTLTDCLPSGARVCEIGCGRGISLDVLRSVGFVVAGIEPSHSGSCYARNRGLDVLTGTFPSISPEGIWDAVVLSHVVEHVSDPIGFLQSAGRLCPGGVVLLVQTNWRGLMPKLLRSRWYAWDIEHHYWHFDIASIKYIAGILGWKVLKVKHSSLVHKGKRGWLARIVGPTLLGDQFQALLRVPL